MKYLKLFENYIETPKVLYHGTHIKNLDDIKKYGLLPDFGDIVKSTEMYQYYMDDNYIDSSDRVDGVLFFSNNPDTWSYATFGRDKNIDEALLVIVENNDSIYKKIGDNYYDYDGNEVYEIDYIDKDKFPFFIENGDYFSFESQKPLMLLYGKALKDYLKGNN